MHDWGLGRDGISFAVRWLDIGFERAAKIDDLLVVETDVAEVSGARLSLEQTIRRGDETIARASVVVVAVKDGRATRLPEAVRTAFGGA